MRAYSSAEVRRAVANGSVGFGEKAEGLARLPPEWVPPFVAVLFSAHPPGGSDVHSAIRTFVGAAGRAGYRRLIVRSNGASEGIGDRGLYDSWVCACDPAAVAETIDELRERDPALNSFVVQRHEAAVALGHLSNERRVSWRSSDWVCEYEPLGGFERPPDRFRPSAPTDSATELALSCPSWAAMVQKLEGIAGWSMDRFKRRSHFEWVWTGGRIWVVQHDEEVEPVSAPPGSAWSARWAGQASAVPDLTLFRPRAEGDSGWPKIRCLETFAECGLPTGEVYVLDGVRAVKHAGSAQMRSDLVALTEVPIVVRTDKRPGTGGAGLMLPRTDSIADVDEVVDFIRRTSATLNARGLDPSEFCFIAHRFIMSRACAFAYSRPDDGRVRIDATWGLPDGLNCYPHDSFEVGPEESAADAGQREKQLRCKTDYLDVDEEGVWKPIRAGSDFDWKASLTTEERFLIAEAARKISGAVGAPVAVMFFVGVAEETGHPPLLPWFYTSDEVPDEFDGEFTGGLFAGRRIYVRSPADLNRVTNEAAATDDRPIFIRLRPSREHIRDFDFIASVAQCAVEHGVPVELEGSMLSHAYYILQREGVRVRCLNGFSPVPGPRQFVKLVRDRVPELIRSRGEKVSASRVGPAELIGHLKRKATEEVRELLEAQSREAAMAEAADVYEVIAALSAALGFTLEDLVNAAASKRDARGGFEEGWVLMQTAEGPLLPGSAPSGYRPLGGLQLGLEL